MPVLDIAQTTTNEDDIIPIEEIGEFIDSFNYEVPVGMGLVWARPGRGNIPQTFPRWEELQDVGGGVTGVPLGTKAETDLFEDREIPMSHEEISAGIVGFRIRRSDEAQESSPLGVSAALVAQALLALVDRMDVDFLSSATSLPVVAGAVTEAYDMDRLRRDIYLHKTLKQRGQRVAALSSGMTYQLHEFLDNTSATLLDRGGVLNIGSNAGYQGRIRGTDIYETDNLPDVATGKAGVMTVAGQERSALGAVLTELPNVRPTRGDDSEGRAVTQLVFRAWYGFGPTSPRKGIQVRGEGEYEAA